mgnify:CR=1 FL=1
MKLMMQYTVVDPAKFLYRMESPQFLMARLAEAALTDVLGGMGVDDVLTVARPGSRGACASARRSASRKSG